MCKISSQWELHEHKNLHMKSVDWIQQKHSTQKFSLSVSLSLGNLLLLDSDPSSYHNLKPYKLPQQKPSSWTKSHKEIMERTHTPPMLIFIQIGAIPTQVTMKCKISQESPMELTISSSWKEIYRNFTTQTLNAHSDNNWVYCSPITLKHTNCNNKKIWNGQNPYEQDIERTPNFHNAHFYTKFGVLPPGW
jgi:hypothetical protein